MHLYQLVDIISQREPLFWLQSLELEEMHSLAWYFYSLPLCFQSQGPCSSCMYYLEQRQLTYLIACRVLAYPFNLLQSIWKNHNNLKWRPLQELQALPNCNQNCKYVFCSKLLYIYWKTFLNSIFTFPLMLISTFKHNIYFFQLEFTDLEKEFNFFPMNL